MNGHLSHRFGARGWRRIVAFLAAAILAGPAALHTGCMGGTTGVDNPGVAELPVHFRDAAGDVALVQGTLEIYARDHNPAITSEPLLRIEIANRTDLTLTSRDFDRIDSARARKEAVANWKRSAGAKIGMGAGGAARIDAGSAGAASSVSAVGATGSAGSDSLIRFNLVLRNGSGSGAVATGLRYDPANRRFSLDSAGPDPEVRMLPRPLIRFAARIHREAASGDLGRIFLPGTPFQATLVDSDFALQNLPEGRFGMHLLGGDGYIYAVSETLDTRAAGHAFTAAPDPIGRVDAAIAPAGFGVDAGGPLNATMQESVGLQGRLLGADSADSRVSVLWRLLRSLSSDSAHIAEPTRLSTQILFPNGGGYSVELAATLGATTVRDTLQFKVAPIVTPTPAKFLAPQPGDSVQQGLPSKVAWDSPISGRARLEYTYSKDGTEGTWSIAVDSLTVAPGGNTAQWTPSSIGTGLLCLLRVRMIPSDSVLAQTPAPFIVFP
jgi:hypothetical protein